MPQTPTFLVAAAATLMLAGSALAQPLPRNNPAAEQNVIQSHHYSQVLRTSPSFRTNRIQEECGPITDPHLHAECAASFPPGAPPMQPMPHPVRHHHRHR